MKQSVVHRIRVAALVTLAAAIAACTDTSSTSITDVNGRTGSPSGAVAASMTAYQGDSQSATVGNAVPNYPVVIVADANGHPVPGVTVSFAVIQGGGKIQNASSVTDARGMASGGTWTLGAAAGSDVVVATTGNVSPVRFTATALAVAPTPSGSYNIVIRWVATPTAAQKQAVDNAVAKWQSVITGDLPDIPLQSAVNTCWQGQPAINERIDDIVIYVDFSDIDGPGKTLGESGPCYVRSDSNLPILGHLKLDNADLQMMQTSGTLNDVVLHEMGHILGIGTIWPDKNLLQLADSTNPRFEGPNAIAAYHAMGGLDSDIAVENTGGDGTKFGHWRESTFGNELMTGYISGTPNPMSAMTIASLTDLGYNTNSSAAGSYVLTNRTSSLRAGTGLNIDGHEKLHGPKFQVDKSGRQRSIR